jgi:hypothetical protein
MFRFGLKGGVQGSVRMCGFVGHGNIEIKQIAVHVHGHFG